MKGTRVFAAVVALFALSAVGIHAEDWKLDKTHSNVGFTVRHMLVSKVNGHFKDFDATVIFDPANIANSTVEFAVQTTSISTDNERRDNHLRSGDFFLVDSFPQMTFKSTKIEPGTGDNFKIMGDLTMRGITKPVTFDVVKNGMIETARGDRAGFSATTTIKRMEFGVQWNAALETGGLVVSDDVTINLEIQLVKPKPEPAPKG